MPTSAVHNIAVMTVAAATSNGDMSSAQNATERIVDGRRSNVSDEVYHVTTERHHQTTKTTVEFDSPLIEVQLSLLSGPAIDCIGFSTSSVLPFGSFVTCSLTFCLVQGAR